MTTISIKKYDPFYAVLWDEMVSKAKNGTFLFYRDFIEYHKDRFEEHSVLVLENNVLIAIFPANVHQNTIYSHQGLTYGGFLYESLKIAKVLEVFKAVLRYYNTQGFAFMQIKSIPSIYHKKPAEELLYLLFVAKSKLIRRDALAVISTSNVLGISRGRMEGVQKGKKRDLKVVEENKFGAFWQKILIPNLEKKHQANPVHSLSEIEYLQRKFPKNIRQFNVYYKDEIVAGTTIFESDLVAHAQYISANENKNELGSLDFLYHILITEVFANKKYIDFGISNEDQGKKLNGGLSFWKESFGASTVIQDFYEIATSNYTLLDNVLL